MHIVICIYRITIDQDGLIGINSGVGIDPVANRGGLIQRKQAQVNG
jgi:hypothetical protein